MIEPVSFRNHGQQLVGILHVPDTLESGEKAPGIVMFHGFTGNKSEAHRLFVYVARALCDSGFIVLRFDFRGSGDSDGEFDDMTVPGEVSDAEKALTFLASQESVDRERIGVIGLSMGGRVAAILASRDRRARFAVLYSAALGPLRERFLSQIEEATLQKLDSGEAIKVGDGWYLRKAFFDSIDDPVPLDIMGNIEVPVLLVHSDTDQVVPIDDSRKGYEIVQGRVNDKNEFYKVKGGDHTFSERKHTNEVIAKTLDWVKSLGLETRD